MSFVCEKCVYSTDNKQHFNNHLKSNKHNRVDSIKIFSCEKCNKIYKSYTGLWRHNKICKSKVIPNELTNEIIESHNGLKEMLKILIKKVDEIPVTNTTNTTNNNNHGIINNITILNMLNENFKNVITFEEFIKNITIDFHDIKDIKDRESCIECLNNIMVNRLKEYQVNERPFHCIKDEDDNSETFMKNSEWIQEYTKDYDDQTPVLGEKVINFIAKVDKDIHSMEIDDDSKSNLKKILRGITKKDNIKRMKEELFYGIQINKYELNHNLLV
jgi:autonomous glycyl radical cofactor GrcA